MYCSLINSYALFNGGDKGNRTLDPLRARQMLSHLSYIPKRLCLSMTQIEKLEAGVGFEPTTTSLWGLSADHCIILLYYGGEWRIRTFEAVTPTSLAGTHNKPLWQLSNFIGAGDRNRTYNIFITSEELCLLSYASILNGAPTQNRTENKWLQVTRYTV